MFARRRSLVLCVVVLVLTGTVLPVTAVGSVPGDPPALSAPAESYLDSSSVERNESPVERKLTAIEKIEAMETGWRFQGRQRDRASELLNGTLSNYRDPHRVNSPSVFRDDRRALGALATIDWIDPSASDEAADLVVAADLASVNTSIEDARFALERTEDRIDDRRELRRAERAIERAERARDRGLDVLADDEWSSWRSTDRQQALVHFGIAWLRAQYALDVLDRASAPAVTIQTRSDPAWDGSGGTTRTIQGNVSDVRAYELENVSVAVNGSPVGFAPLIASPAPGRNASFTANVSLDGHVAEVSVTVTDVDGPTPSRLDGGREGPWSRFDRPAGRRSALDERFDRFDRIAFDGGTVGGQSDTAVVRYDGDGLPDEYEMTVVGTDPLDPDSDSGVTDSDEAGDGVPDGGEDLDDDGLITYAEYELGTDPFSNDSDGDGLPDRFEASIPALLDPTAADTDDDGVIDGAEDFDGDGLSVAAEHTNGTSIARPDTDLDGLDDGEEVAIYGTSPLLADTDDDGLGDTEELRLGTDPLVTDTDGDGVVDGEESYETTATDEGTGVHIAIEGSGDVASAVSVENVSQPSGSDFLVAPVVRVHNRTGFENASLTIPIDDDTSYSDSANLSVYKWSPEDERPWHPLNSTVDVANGTASATVSSFSFFTVMDGPEWEEAITATTPIEWPLHEDFGDLDGWSVEGNAVVSDGVLVASGERGADVVVAQDGNGDFRRIQPAVDSASSGDTILVRAGTYHETLVLDKSVRLAGEGAALSGSGLADSDAGISVVDGTSVTVAGFEVRGFDVGIAGASTSANLLLTETVLRDNALGVSGWKSSGNWTFEEVEISENRGDGIYAWAASGDWTLTGATVAENDGYGVYASETSGSWSLVNTNASANAENGVDAAYSTGDWSLVDIVASDNDEDGLFASGASGDWSFSDVRASRNGDGPGLDASFATGNWSLTSVAFSRNAAAGIDGFRSSGNWRVENAALTGNRGAGLGMHAADGRWTVTNARLVGNGKNGGRATDATGTVVLSNSSIHGNGKFDLDASGAASPVDASNNWWGETTGPSDGQVRGNVFVDPACPSPDCVSYDRTTGLRRSDYSVASRTPRRTELQVGDSAGGGATVVSRDLVLRDAVETTTLSTRVAGRGSAEDPATVRVRKGGAVSTVAVVDSSVADFTVESADLSRFAGQTVTVELVAEGDAELSVDWIDVAYDTDGDGLRDAVESAALGMPSGPRPGAPLASLDPTNPDSDGDGLLDGEELTEVSVEHRSGVAGGSPSFRAESAAADPTIENSDGGGLNDGEEVAAGSDPFVLETLVVGYAIPTMTHGPDDTLEDRQPMTVGEANGLEAGGGRDSNVIAWPSRQYFDRLFCIKELTAGPGCSKAWMRGVELQDDKHYVYVPFVVYAQSNVEIGEVPYELSTAPHWNAKVVKEVNTTGTVERGRSQRGYVVYELPEDQSDFELQRRVFRPLGELTLDADLTNTVFERSESSTVGRRYTVSTSTTLPRTEQMLQDTQFVLEQGIKVAFAAETGYRVAIETGSRLRGALAFLYHLAKSQISTPPTLIEDVAKKVSQKGIAAFEEKVRETRGDIDEDIFGDGAVRSVGPTIIRQN